MEFAGEFNLSSDAYLAGIPSHKAVLMECFLLWKEYRNVCTSAGKIVDTAFRYGLRIFSVYRFRIGYRFRYAAGGTGCRLGCYSSGTGGTFH